MSELAGLRIVVTRPEPQAAELCERLRAAGAEPVRFPTIAIAPPASFDPLDRALRGLAGYDWVVFTSANGVRSALARAAQLGLDESAWSAVRVAAVGPATAGELHARGIQIAAVPDEYLTERIADAVGPAAGERFLLLRAEVAGELLPAKLRGIGAIVDEAAAYRTVERVPDDRAMAALRPGCDVITFTSPSTVRGFASALGDSLHDVVAGAIIAVIGPVTAAEAKRHGLEVHVEAEEHTMDGLVRALERHFGGWPEREVGP